MIAELTPELPMKKTHLKTGWVRGRITGTNALKLNGADSPHIRRGWKRYYQSLLKLHQRLLSDRADQLLEIAEPLESGGIDIAKSASAEASQDLALCEVLAEQTILLQIEEALERIRNGTYGICQLTQLPIEKARLQAVPWTRFSKAAAEQLEKQPARNGAKSRK